MKHPGTARDVPCRGPDGKPVTTTVHTGAPDAPGRPTVAWLTRHRSPR